MGFWSGFLFGILTIVLAEILLFFLLPILEEPRRKLLNFIYKKPKIKTTKHKDKKLLQEITKPLLLINQFPHFPDTKIEELRDALLEIGEKANKVKSKEYSEMKEKLLNYSKNVDKLHVNISLNDLFLLLGIKEGQTYKPYKLVEEIRNIINDG